MEDIQQMLKMRNRSESKLSPRLPLVWDDDATDETAQTAASSLPVSDDDGALHENTTPVHEEPDVLHQLKQDDQDAEVYPEDDEITDVDDFSLDDENEDADTPDDADEFPPEDERSDDSEAASSDTDDTAHDDNNDEHASNTVFSTARPNSSRYNDEPEIIELNEDEPLGDTLIKLRAKVGCTIQDVFVKTRIPLKCIKALEQGDYEILPKLTICQAYLESLCKEYDVNPESLRHKLEQEYIRILGPDGNHNSNTPIDTKMSHATSLPGFLIAALLVILLIFILSGILKLAFKKDIERPKVDLTQLVPLQPQPIQILPIPDAK